MKVAGRYAYVALESAGLGVFDVLDPAQPVWLGSFDTRGWAYDLELSGLSSTWRPITEGCRFST